MIKERGLYKASLFFQILGGALKSPEIEIPEQPTLTQVLYAAACADNYSDHLLVEATLWREKAHDLYDQADALKGR